MVQAMEIAEKDEPLAGESKFYSIPCHKGWCMAKNETPIAQARLRI